MVFQSQDVFAPWQAASPGTPGRGTSALGYGVWSLGDLESPGPEESMRVPWPPLWAARRVRSLRRRARVVHGTGTLMFFRKIVENYGNYGIYIVVN